MKSIDNFIDKLQYYHQQRKEAINEFDLRLHNRQQQISFVTPSVLDSINKFLQKEINREFPNMKDLKRVLNDVLTEAYWNPLGDGIKRKKTGEPIELLRNNMWIRNMKIGINQLRKVEFAGTTIEIYRDKELKLHALKSISIANNVDELWKKIYL